MNDAEIERLVNMTVNKTVLKLKMSGMMKDNRMSIFQKTEEMLKNYNSFCFSEQPYAQKIVGRIEEALNTIKDDPYSEVINLYYFEGYSREQIAEEFGTSVTTISRNKTRLINKLKTILFSDDFLLELYN